MGAVQALLVRLPGWPRALARDGGIGGLVAPPGSAQTTMRKMKPKIQLAMAYRDRFR